MSSHARPNLAEVSETSGSHDTECLEILRHFHTVTSAILKFTSILFKFIASKAINEITLEALITEYSNITI